MTDVTEFAPGLLIRGIQPPLKLADYKLIAFDMDSTLITIECIDEIADATGKKAEVSAITEATMRGEITDFKDSLRQRVGKLVGVTEADMARVLAEPTLVALSGQSASFLAGGELPILEPQGLGTTTITYKPFGIGLTVTPTVLAANRIALKVAPEASDLDYSNSIMLNNVQIPSITTRRADTTVELGDGESFVIGGLVSSNVVSNVSKIPLLGDLPVIGSFFRNFDYKRQDKELVIIVTPRLVQPLARNTELPLPGEREAKPHLPEWGSWLLGPVSQDPVPGFSR